MKSTYLKTIRGRHNVCREWLCSSKSEQDPIRLHFPQRRLCVADKLVGGGGERAERACGHDQPPRLGRIEWAQHGSVLLIRQHKRRFDADAEVVLYHREDDVVEIGRRLDARGEGGFGEHLRHVVVQPARVRREQQRLVLQIHRVSSLETARLIISILQKRTGRVKCLRAIKQ